ncbi:unannotated protein [freshwater metagenome]|uniref:Unannotated protein n=1 Tax=freshwater metagenome TaxID=449393 RepID=A0A6J6E0K2_9ZZZZ
MVASAARRERRTPRLDSRSMAINTRAAPVNAPANSVAAPRSPVPNHTRITPSAMVLTLKSRTVPMSVSTSIATRAAPAAIEGRAAGSDTLKKVAMGLAPRLRAAAKVSAP